MKADAPRRTGFTLIELLVVIAIIAMLAALVLPGLSKAKASARRTQCIGNLKQISLGVLMYADDNHRQLPGRKGTVPGLWGWHAYKSLIKISWHQPGNAMRGNYRFNNARCVTSFLDGRVKYIPFYYDVTKAKGEESWHYDPPPEYKYRWSAR